MTFPGGRAEDHQGVNGKRRGYIFWHLTAFGLCSLPLFSPQQRRKKQSKPQAKSMCSKREVPQHGGYHSTFSPLCLELRAAAGPGCAAGAGTLSPLCPFTLLLVGSCAAVGSSSSKPLRLHPARVLETERGHAAGEGLPPVLGPALLGSPPAW